ncbi:hypothetical protein BCh11DRAFT_02807 [Burkholderia sp. Ch1-1]|nr:hypothetical protein BCh11DRAFT_02807 [Burkholderia sp. Ch1-1]
MPVAGWSKRARARLFISVSFVLVIFLDVFPAFGSPSWSDKPLLVDRVWAGTRVGFDAVIGGTKAYVGYYDADRYLTIAEVDLQSGDVKRKRIDSRYTGWDSHNYIALAYDSHGILHVSGNEHATPLVYARMQAPGVVSSLQLEGGLVGTNEEMVTYPVFLQMQNGQLAFIYRDGGSGNGDYIVDSFDGKTWARLMSSPLFSSEDGRRSVNAYPTQFMRDKSGRFHVAWVWRASPDARTNFDVSYAWSRDLVHWFNANGKQLALPIGPRSDAGVDIVPAGAGLFNNLRLGFDLGDRPVISFQRYDAQGFSQIYHAVRRENGWRISPFTNWQYRWNFGGTRSILAEISFSGIQAEDRLLTETVHSTQYGAQLYTFDPETLDVRQVSVPVAVHRPVAFPKFSAPYGPNQLAVRGAPNDSGAGYTLVWGALPADNRDSPRTCAAPSAAAACAFVSEIYLVRETGGR